jgi:AbrB family looped-hinge helix DNA binding protein
MSTYPTTISSKGQVVIPSELRKRLRLKSGSRAVWRERNGELVLTSFDHVLDELQGFLKPVPGQPSAFEESLAERERQRKRERELER